MRRCALFATMLLLAATIAMGGERVLFDFEGGFEPATVSCSDARARLVERDGGRCLRIETFHRKPWPGITLPAPKGKWDLAPYGYLALDVKNVGTNKVTVYCRVDNKGADGRRNCVTGWLALEVGQSGSLEVELHRNPPGVAQVKLFGMRGLPQEAATSEGTIDPRAVTQLLIFVARPKEDHAFEVDNIRATGTYQPPKTQTPKSFFPFIDTFGQYMHREWPGKTHSVEDLERRLAEENKDLEAHPGPPDWDKFGGWKSGPTLKATGFFYPVKHEGKWWLVDPEGRLFWSHGIDCVRAGEGTPIDDRRHWFADFPGDRPEFKDCWWRQGHVVRGYYAGKRPMCFSFYRANLIRKYGPEWRERFADMAHRRLRSWGLNTIANWSDPQVYLARRTPYVVAIHFGSKTLEGSRGYWKKFHDVFDPSFRRSLRRRMSAEKGKSAGDPWCIGYFVDNELSWGDELSLAIAALTSPPDQAAKRVFVEDLKAKYGAIEKLNGAWGTRYPSWEALLASRSAPDRKRTRADLVAFTRKTAETYFRTVRECVKEVAPKNLYLGCRFAWSNAVAVAAAAKYCDVVSFNRYAYSAGGLRLPGGLDRPIIIGEFHFGALDRGMFHTGLRKVANQQERGKAYRRYVESALRNPFVVGTGWFKFSDEPTTGRGLDGENYQIGFVDCCDTPYPETIEACRQVGYRLYEIRSQAR